MLSRFGRELYTLKGLKDGVLCATFSSDDKRIISGSQDGSVKIWDAGTGQEILTLNGHKGWVTSLLFSPDRQRIVSGSLDGTVKIWETAEANGNFDSRRISRHVDALFARFGLKDVVLANLKIETNVSKTDLHKAIELVHTHGEVPEQLNSPAWKAIKNPGRNRDIYALGLRQAEAASHLDQNNCLDSITFGVAQYRMGLSLRRSAPCLSSRQ
jgi:hypothetical protein